MTIIKIILFVLGLILAGWLAFAVIAFLYSSLTYILIFGALALTAYVGYKIVRKDRRLELEDRRPVSQIELDNARAVKTIEDYSRKYGK